MTSLRRAVKYLVDSSTVCIGRTALCRSDLEKGTKQVRVFPSHEVYINNFTNNQSAFFIEIETINKENPQSISAYQYISISVYLHISISAYQISISAY